MLHPILKIKFEGVKIMNNNQFYRITAYYPQDDFSFIIDSNGKFAKLWQFSSYLVNKGIQIVEVSKEEQIIDINIEKPEIDNECLILRATADGKPEYLEQTINGITYKAVKVADKIYIPNSN